MNSDERLDYSDEVIEMGGWTRPRSTEARRDYIFAWYCKARRQMKISSRVFA
jgi:hypothetical protein